MHKVKRQHVIVKVGTGSLPIFCVLNPIYIHAAPAGTILNDLFCTLTFMIIYL